MNHYVANVRVQGHSYRTGIIADNPISARVLLQFMFGAANVISLPVVGESGSSDVTDAIQLYLAEGPLRPIVTVKPKTPEQAEIASLQARVKLAQQAVKVARARQQMIRAQKSI